MVESETDRPTDLPGRELEGARSDLVEHDLNAAREAWIAEGKSEKERAKRSASDVLCKRNASGEVFDFHALRVQFISGLPIAGVSLTAALQLAGHSTPNLYTR